MDLAFAGGQRPPAEVIGTVPGSFRGRCTSCAYRTPWRRWYISTVLADIELHYDSCSGDRFAETLLDYQYRSRAPIPWSFPCGATNPVGY